jgi:thioredoxin 1
MKTAFSDIINQPVPVLVDFYADWCGPCHMMAPILQEVKGMLGENVKIVKIDVDRNPAVSQQFGIRSIPTMVLFKNGELLWRHSGVVRAPELANMIREKAGITNV